MQVSPALPWAAETVGGTIILASPVSYDDILDDVLQFTLDHNGTPLIANVGEGSSGVVIGYGDDDTVNIVYSIARFEGEQTVLTLTRDEGAQADGYVLADVKRATGPLAEVYADQACTTRPVDGQSYTHLFVKLNKAINYGDSAYFEYGGAFTYLALNAPSEDAPEDPYSIQLYLDFMATELSEGYMGVIECQVSGGESITIETPLLTDFGKVYE